MRRTVNLFLSRVVGSTPTWRTMKGKRMKHLLAFGLIVVTILCVEGAPWVAIGSIIGAWLLERNR